MPIIIDTNCLGNVFSRSSEFEPVLDWIVNGTGIMVYGGTKYITELAGGGAKNGKYLRIVRLLKDVRKALTGDKEEIDRMENLVKSKHSNKKFNDEHLVAISIVTRCRLICSEDKTSFSFIKNPEFYPSGSPIPKFYTKKRNSNLLCDSNIDKCFKPLLKCKKVVSEKLASKISSPDSK